jgi:hypothetical protein
MWYALQGSIMFAVVASNIHWRWTPNAYLAAACGWLAAYLATLAVDRLMHRLGL